jgi:ornithine decarboxylase
MTSVDVGTSSDVDLVIDDLVRGDENPASSYQTPHLVLDIDRAVEQFLMISAAFGSGSVHYAVKANPHPTLLEALVRAGSRFDVASPGEVHACLRAGAAAIDLLYSNPVKRTAHITAAWEAGVRRFVTDSDGEVAKVAAAAPGSEVLIRIDTSGEGSDWPLSGKFGCAPQEAVALLRQAADLGLEAAGIAFHVGSQQRDPSRWEAPIASASRAFGELRDLGIDLRILDIGGGLPAAHEGNFPSLGVYRDTIFGALERYFGSDPPELIIEPGRGVVGDAGWLTSEVVGVNWRGGRRWVYVDVGVYTGLVETLGEATRYRLFTERGESELGPAVLAGPTCDSVDVLYEKAPVMLPLSLQEGDRIVFGSAGAYTTSYSTVGFNGFAPLPTICRRRAE